MPYKVFQKDDYFPLQKNWTIPHEHKEQEIVIIDFNSKMVKPNYLSESKINNVDIRIDQWWVNHKKGIVDPGLLMGNLLNNDIERILNYGGILIVFAHKFNKETFNYGHFYGHEFKCSKELSCHTWNILNINNIYQRLGIGFDYGSSISQSKDGTRKDPIVRLLSKYLVDSKYHQTFKPYGELKEKWKSLLINKFGNYVGGIIMPDKDRIGHIFIFPDINDKPSFIVELINEILPDLSPQLFPHINRSSWKNNSVYDLKKVKEIKQKISQICKEKNRRITSLKQAISKEKQNFAYLFNILSETGTPLVKSTIEALKSIGFQNIIDVDEEIKNEGKTGQNKEDLQIQINNYTLIVEIKGINNFPKDDDCRTVNKYVTLRMREWNNTNVKGLSIINHQRILPPLERDNETPFRPEIIEVAQEEKIGLMTTFDLHRLVRSFHHNNWDHNNISSLFYKNGRILPIPTHYKCIGTIERFIEKIQVIGVKISESEISKGDRIAFELPLVFEEQNCDSIEIENNPVEKAEAGKTVGIKTHLTKDQAKIGTKVYRILDQ